MERVREWLISAPVMKKDDDGEETHYISSVVIGNQHLNYATFTATDDWWHIEVDDNGG